jgi:hypothetical protein
MTPDRAALRRAVERALLDFHRSPGKYPLVRRQPSVLFASIKDVLQIAAGRAPDTDNGAAPAAAVQKAACFFVRSALLYPDADHYALLGLDAGTEAAAIKDRYRQMMRLMHPDFTDALGGANWPADAATRVNQAYGVLSSPARRRAYDEARDPPAPPAQPTHAEPRAAFRSSTARPAVTHPRYRLKQLAIVFGLTGCMILAATLYVGSTDERESLVQRSREIDAMVSAALPLDKALPVRIEASAPDPLALETEKRDVAEAALPQPPSAAAAAALVGVPAPLPAPLVVALAAPAPARAPIPAPAPARALPPVLPVAAAPAPAVETFTPAQPAPATIAPAPAPAPAPVVVAAPPTIAAIPAPPPTIAVPVAVTLADVHPLLSKLLQQMESGWGDQVLNVLEREARAAPAAQALARNYNALLEGGHRVRLANVQFRAEPRDGRLLVIGHVSMLVGEPAPGAAPKQFWVQAEFASRDGSVVMTRLAQVDN